MSFDSIRTALKAAESSRSPMGPASDMVEGGLSLDDAHAVCEATIAGRVAAGEEIRGYKVGFTNIPVREKMGLPDSTYGYLLDRMVLADGGELAMSELIAPKIECEITFQLGKDLGGKGLSIDDVLAATSSVRATFEICDARIKDWKCPYADFFADNAFSARCILGAGDWTPVDQVDLLAEEVTLTREGEELARGKGEMAMGHPANAVSWLAAKLADRDKHLRAGDIVMTGTLTPILAIEAPATYVATFSTLGAVTKRFV